MKKKQEKLIKDLKTFIEKIYLRTLISKDKTWLNKVEEGEESDNFERVMAFLDTFVPPERNNLSGLFSVCMKKVSSRNFKDADEKNKDSNK